LNQGDDPQCRADPKHRIAAAGAIACELEQEAKAERAEHGGRGPTCDQHPLNAVAVGRWRDVDHHAVAACVVKRQAGDGEQCQGRESGQVIGGVHQGKTEKTQRLHHQADHDVGLAVPESQQVEPVG
jgi:hypothetical protein